MKCFVSQSLALLYYSDISAKLLISWDILCYWDVIVRSLDSTAFIFQYLFLTLSLQMSLL